jgi:cob(I)alamin adenosyltransferase
MKIYTRTGDAGTTALFGGGRVRKSHPRVAAYGTVDELNSAVGWAIAVAGDARIRERLSFVQHDLFTLGADLARPPKAEGRKRPEVPELPLPRIAEMERWMDEAEGELAPLREFILPGGAPGAAALHLTRTVCRRAEREIVALAENEPIDAEILRYLNRLSDLLFVFARLENARTGTTDVVWRKDEGPASPEAAPSGSLDT